MMQRIQRYFLSGLVVFAPVVMTIYLFLFTLKFADGLLGKYIQPHVRDAFGFYIPGLGLLLTLYIILLCGFFVTNFLGKRIYAAFEGIFLKLPFFKQVYPAIKEMALFLFAQDKVASSFKQAVLVEYPRKGVYSMGFLTNDSIKKLSDATQKTLCNVFVPTSPSPLTGFVVLVPKEEIIMTDIKIEDAFKFIMSGGVVNP